MKKSNLSKYLLFVGIATLLTIMVVIIQKSYTNLMDPINQVKTSVQIKPIDPDLDIDTLNLVDQKKEYSVSDLDTVIQETTASTDASSSGSPASVLPDSP